MIEPAAFYCVADDRYFLGAAAMINSLRLQGHSEPVYVLDCGLRQDHRDLLEAEATVVASSGDEPPWLRKAELPLSHPARVSVLIDTDMIVTRSLAEPIARAEREAIVAFRDRQQRHFAEWGDLLGLGPARPGPYVSSGFVACGGDSGREVLQLLYARRDTVDFERTFWRQNARDYPVLYADQDVLNAILASTTAREALVALDERLAATPPYRGLTVVDEAALWCRYRDGVAPYLVHQYVRKPWLEPTYHSLYSRLWRRLLIADDVAIRPPLGELPPRMRVGARAAAQRAGTSARDFLRWHLGDRVPGPLAMRLEDRRRRREARSR